LGNADVRLAFEPQPLSPDKDRRNKNSASVAKSPSKPAPPPLPIDMMKQQQPIQQQIQVPAPPPSSAPLLRPPDAASARVGGAPHAGAGRGDRRHRMQAPGNSRDPLDSARAESISLPDIAPPRNAGSHPHPLDSRRQQQQAAVRSRKQSTNSAPHALSSERRSGMEVLEDEGMLALPQLQTPAAHHQQQPRRPKK
jgi:type IV secretory pathway VirB10-like protein